MSLLDLLLDHPFADDDPLVHTVASSVTKAEMRLSPKAIAAMDAEWTCLKKLRTWIEEEVEEWDVYLGVVCGL